MPKKKEKGPPTGYDSELPLFQTTFSKEQFSANAVYNDPKIIEYYNLTGRLYDSREQAEAAILRHQRALELDARQSQRRIEIPEGGFNDVEFELTELAPDLKDTLPPAHSAARDFKSQDALTEFQQGRKFPWQKKEKK